MYMWYIILISASAPKHPNWPSSCFKGSFYFTFKFNSFRHLCFSVVAVTHKSSRGPHTTQRWEFHYCELAHYLIIKLHYVSCCTNPSSVRPVIKLQLKCTMENHSVNLCHPGVESDRGLWRESGVEKFCGFWVCVWAKLNMTRQHSLTWSVW